MQNQHYGLGINNEVNSGNNKKIQLARPVTVHSYFSQFQETVEDNNKIHSVKKRLNKNVNKLLLKTTNVSHINTKWFLILLYVVMLIFITALVIIIARRNLKGSCLTSVCVESAAKSLKYLNSKIDPCDDFYSFACDGLVNEQTLPDEVRSKNAFTALEEIVGKQHYDVINTSLSNKLSAQLHLKQFLVQCNSKNNTYNLEIDNINSILNSLGEWPMLMGKKWNESNFDLLELTLRLKNIGIPYDFIFEFKVLINIEQTDNYIIMPVFKKPEIHAPEIYKTVCNIIHLLGGSQSIIEENFREYLKLLELIRKESEPENNPKYTTLKLLTNITGINWVPYVKRLFGMENVTINENEPIYLLHQLIRPCITFILKTSKRIQANFILIEIIKWMYAYLPSLNYVIEKRVKKTSECVYELAKSLPLIVNSLYVRRFFDNQTKNQVEKLVQDLRHEFLKNLQTLNWLDDDTRKNAIEKLKSMKTCVGYPDELLDDKGLEDYYQTLSINYTSFLNAIMSINVFETSNNLKRLRKKVHKCYWIDESKDVTTINALYSSLNNAIKLPAAFFQDMIFDRRRPSYMNYAIAGMVIGHEITHGFDNMGRMFDKNGNLRKWWSDETFEAFNKKTECIIKQYNNFKVPKLNSTVNGLLTLAENIADNGGLKQSFLAYNNWVKRNGNEKTLPGLNYTPSQLFWISYAQFMCSYDSFHYQKNMLEVDVHSPPKFRVIGTLSNSMDFSNDFKCPIGSPMNPKNKCKIW